MKTSKSFCALLETFFTDRLMTQQNVSPNTIASYRDAFRLLLRYVQRRFHKRPSDLKLEDLNATVICDFLSHLESQRGNVPRSRNVRLVAIRSFFQYVAFEEPTHAELIQRVLAIPGKRWQRPLVTYLSPLEVEALVNATDKRAANGRRDYILLLLATQTGLRVSELTGLRCKNIVFGRTGTYVHCHGKGRKERSLPLTKPTAKLLRTWLKERNSSLEDYLFTNARGNSLSRDGVAYILNKCLAIAQRRCPSLRLKRVSPHVLRHTNAVNLLQAGVDQSVIALWLGHESVETTQVYLHADLAYKEKVLAKLPQNRGKPLTYHPDDQLLQFLNSL